MQAAAASTSAQAQAVWARLAPNAHCKAGLAVVAGVCVLACVRRCYARRLLPPVDARGQKTVLITGCDSGFGLRTAKHLAQQGYKVLAGCLTQKGVSHFDGTSNVHAFLLDVTSEQSVADSAALVAQMCPDGLHALVNNAGILEGKMIDFDKGVDHTRRVFEVNYFGVVAMAMALLPQIRRRRGHIVNVASIAGRIAGAGMSAYCGSKFAVEAFSDVIRREQTCFGVKVSVIEPGFMRTEGLVEQLVKKDDFSHVPAETLALYGDEFIGALAQHKARILNGSADPQKVVDAIAHAVGSAAPRTHYVVGVDANVVRWLVMLPAAWLDSLLYTLPAPRPAAAWK